MKNRRILFTLSALLAVVSAATVVVAQDTKPETCPEVTVIGPPAEPKTHESGDYSVIVDLKGINQEILLEWSAIGGKVLEGQGTYKAKIQRTSDEFSVSVRVRGRRPRCEQVHSFRSAEADRAPPEAIMLDRIVGTLSNSDETVKRFVEATKIEQTRVFWVILGFKKTESAAKLSERRRSLLESFNTNGRIGHDVRVTFVDVEADEDFVEFWKTTADARPRIIDK